MTAQGRDCSIVIKTVSRETALLYCGETIREAPILLTEEASIEGDGVCRAIRKSGGVAGCVVTPLTIGTAPLLLHLAMGSAGLPLYVSETRNLFRHELCLLPAENSVRFAVLQDRGDSRKLYEDCAVTGFELRIVRDEAVKLKLDIAGDTPLAPYSSTGACPAKAEERFKEDGVRYRIDNAEHRGIYGLTVASRKQGGTRTEARIHRVLGTAEEIPPFIETLEITARLLRDVYERRSLGMFRLILSRLVLMADETVVDSADAVIGPLRYYVAGMVAAEVFTTEGESLT